MDPITIDLTDASGHWIAHALKKLPQSAQKAVASAIEDGGWLELRTGLMNRKGYHRLGICNLDGGFVELVTLEISSD